MTLLSANSPRFLLVIKWKESSEGRRYGPYDDLDTARRVLNAKLMPKLAKDSLEAWGIFKAHWTPVDGGNSVPQ